MAVCIIQHILLLKCEKQLSLINDCHRNNNVFYQISQFIVVCDSDNFLHQKSLYWIIVKLLDSVPCDAMTAWYLLLACDCDCVYVHLSVTSWYCIKMAAWFQLIFSKQASLTYPVLCSRKLGYFCLKLCPNSGQNFAMACSPLLSAINKQHHFIVDNTC